MSKLDILTSIVDTSINAKIYKNLEIHNVDYLNGTKNNENDIKCYHVSFYLQTKCSAACNIIIYKIIGL